MGIKDSIKNLFNSLKDRDQNESPSSSEDESTSTELQDTPEKLQVYEISLSDGRQITSVLFKEEIDLLTTTKSNTFLQLLASKYADTAIEKATLLSLMENGETKVAVPPKINEIKSSDLLAYLISENRIPSVDVKDFLMKKLEQLNPEESVKPKR